MIKKLFALASVSALSRLFATAALAGCSGTSVLQTTADGAVGEEQSAGNPDGATRPVDPPPVEAGVDAAAAADAGRDADAGGDAEAGSGIEAGPSTCPTTDPIDATSAPWKPPAVDLGKCQEQDILDLVAFADANKMATYAQVKAAVADATCSACLFVQDGATWGPVVEKADGSFLRNNFGGCVAVKSGSNACGKAFSQFDDCLRVACQDCVDAATTSKCNAAAAKGACSAAAAAFTTQCGSAAPVTACDNLAATYTFEAAARALCVGP